MAGTQPRRWPDSSETTAGDDHDGSDSSVKVAEDVPAAPEPDQIIPLVMYHQPWRQPPGQPVECPRENDDAVSECEDATSELSSPVKQPPTSREPQKEDKNEVLRHLMDGKRAAWAGDHKM
jgi:hypothetical protein